MSHKTLRTSLGTLAAVAAVTLGSPAHAGHVGANWDPTFHNGVASFFVPDLPSPCLGLGAGFHTVNGSGIGDTCLGVLIESADVNINVPTGPGAVVAHLVLPPPIPASNAITGMVLGNPGDDPAVVGFNSAGISSPNVIQLSAVSCTGDCPTNWFIVFDSGLPLSTLYESTLYDSGRLDGLFNTVAIYEQFCGDGCGPRQLLNDGEGAISTDVTFTTLTTPEPGSLVLLLGALGAGWLARRRKVAA